MDIIPKLFSLSCFMYDIRHTSVKFVYLLPTIKNQINMQKMTKTNDVCVTSTMLHLHCVQGGWLGNGRCTGVFHSG